MSTKSDYLILPEDIDLSSNYLGSKTLNLKKCLDWGFAVPKFVAIPATLSKELLSNRMLRDDIALAVTRLLPAKSYAVRSSALAEDSQQQSLAGQFLTKTAVTADALAESIYTVLEHANHYLNGQVEKCSLLIQVYVVPTVFGVTFTRNPNGQREMIIEYANTIGDNLVAGKISPNTFSLIWNDAVAIKSVPQPLQASVITSCQRLEERQRFPQDVEWCISDNQFYVLQTRPVTTISQQQYKQILYLENILPKSQPYYFAKTEISEIAPRPSPFTLALLQKIYSTTGPVHKVYADNNIHYVDTGALTIIGNELFIDQEKEIQGLFPAYSYFANKHFLPRLRKFSKLPRTFRNIILSNRITTDHSEKHFQAIKAKIETPLQITSLKQSLELFLLDYELIFTINWLAGLALKKINWLLRHDTMAYAGMMTAKSLFVDLHKYHVSLPDHLKGNSLEISDDTNFTAHERVDVQINQAVEAWWSHQSAIRKTMLLPNIQAVIIYDRLREYGRWLTVKHISLLRIELLQIAKRNQFRDYTNIYFSNFDSWLNNPVNEAETIARREKYEQNNLLALPNKLTSSVIVEHHKMIGVSGGKVSGILVDAAGITNERYRNKNIILYTESLTPNLTQYFTNIVGIVSHYGGLLSHLAIVAREQHLPVVVGYPLKDGVVKIGDQITINGVTGEISVMIS